MAIPVTGPVVNVPQYTVLLGLCVAGLLSAAVYRIAFHPLSKYPGPPLWSTSRIPLSFHFIRGTLPYKIQELHNHYGPVVRIAPSELSYTTEDAWADIYGKKPGTAQLRKDPNFAPTPPSGVHGIQLAARDDDHARMRKNLAPAFSEKAVRDLEPVVTKYVDLLMRRLHEHAEKPVNIEHWYNFTLFDLIGDLTFAESFGCLENSKLHVWAQSVFDFIKAVAILSTVMKFSPLDKILLALVPKSLRERERSHRAITNEKLMRRLDLADTRQDFLTHIFKHFDTPSAMTIPELQETAAVLVIAGSETSATLLTGLTYHLLSNPAQLRAVAAETRAAFAAEPDITFAGVARLPRLLAAVNEALRLCPPVPGTLARLTPPGGCVVAGAFVPGATLVAVNHWAAFRSRASFRDPEVFAPERWLGGAEAAPYEGDRLKVVQPFGYGPRNCIGRPLAYAQVRLLMARLLWNFDVELCGESADWAERLKIYLVYEKAPLMVKLTPVRRG